MAKKQFKRQDRVRLMTGLTTKENLFGPHDVGTVMDVYKDGKGRSFCVVRFDVFNVRSTNFGSTLATVPSCKLKFDQTIWFKPGQTVRLKLGLILNGTGLPSGTEGTVIAPSTSGVHYTVKFDQGKCTLHFMRLEGANDVWCNKCKEELRIFSSPGREEEMRQWLRKQRWTVTKTRCFCPACTDMRIKEKQKW